MDGLRPGSPLRLRKFWNGKEWGKELGLSLPISRAVTVGRTLRAPVRSPRTVLEFLGLAL
jgi:hypothetical protein